MIVTPRCWIEEPDENKDGFLEVWTEEYPIPVRTTETSIDDVTLGVESDFNFILCSAMEIEAFADIDDYYQRNEKGFAPEAYVPAGLFSPTSDVNFVPSPIIILHGRVVDIDDPAFWGFGPGYTFLVVSCLEFLFECVVYESHKTFEKLEIGNYISGMFWVRGWPIRETD